MSFTTVHVIFRTCDAVQALHGSRPFGLDKRSLIKECFLSLYQGLQGFNYSIHVQGDKLSAELQAWFGGFCAKDKAVTLSNGDYGNDASIRESLRRAVERPDDEWVYLCEDDYLHVPNFFAPIHDLIENRAAILAYQPHRRFWKWLLGDSGQKPLVIHPADYPDRYRADQRNLSLLFLGADRHWRQINFMTFTFLAEARTIKRFFADCLRSTTGADDALLSRVLLDRVPGKGRGLGVSPMPGLTCHLHQATLTPLVDWAAIHQKLATEIDQKV